VLGCAAAWAASLTWYGRRMDELLRA